MGELCNHVDQDRGFFNYHYPKYFAPAFRRCNPSLDRTLRAILVDCPKFLAHTHEEAYIKWSKLPEVHKKYVGHKHPALVIALRGHARFYWKVLNSQSKLFTEEILFVIHLFLFQM